MAHQIFTQQANRTWTEKMKRLLSQEIPIFNVGVKGFKEVETGSIYMNVVIKIPNNAKAVSTGNTLVDQYALGLLSNYLGEIFEYEREQ